MLRLLPKDATPAQQDSAIQAWFEPNEIRYSEQPDTLHLPGHDIPRNLMSVDIPQYYRENFFSKDSLYHPELDAGRYGVAGDPIPYTIKNDDMLTGLLLLSFLLIVFTFAHSSTFLVKQFKDFFRNPRGESNTETGTEIKVQLVFVVLTCLMCSLLYFFYAKTWIADTYILSSEYTLLAIFGLVFTGYFLLKFWVCESINRIFFDRRTNKKIMTSNLFIVSLEGVAFFPIVLLLSYFSLSPQNAAFFCILVVVFVKLLTFYKTNIIFFRQNADVLQIILYFCALEIVPLTILWGGLAAIANNLKVNF